MNIPKKRILISSLRDPKVHGDGGTRTYSSQSLNIPERTASSSFHHEEAAVLADDLNRQFLLRGRRRGYPSSLDTRHWQITTQLRSTNDTINAVIGDSDWNILMSDYARYNGTQETQTSLLEKDLDQAIEATKDRAESVPNLCDVFGS